MSLKENDEWMEQVFETYPDLIYDAKIKWREATYERKKKDGLLYIEIKGRNPEMSSTQIKASIDSNAERHPLVIAELKAEATYERLYEQLMTAKKMAGMKNGF